jgi:hypothetical protein
LGGLLRSATEGANKRKAVKKATADERIPGIGPILRATGKTSRVNVENRDRGVRRARAQKRDAARQRGYSDRMASDVAHLFAREKQRQGRTPAKDAAQQRLEAARRMGIRV